MQVCAQCNGKGATIAQNEIIGQAPSGTYTENYQIPNNAPGAIPCSQCNGKGYQYS